jgi:pimeloyl-ACP methyl ester carboxylesterase
MAAVRVNGVELYCELTGTGSPLVLVHGSWTDHRSWDAVPGLAESFRLLRYDRPGQNQSERLPGQGGIREDDVAQLSHPDAYLDVVRAFAT